MKKKYKSLYNAITKNKIIIIVITVVCVAFIIFYKIHNNEEAIMKRYVQDYYDENIKGKVIGIDRQIVTLSDLQRAGFNVNKLIDNCDKEKSFAYVILENPKEQDKDRIKYTIETHLVCR